jgi:thiol:disulfide interchange protein
VPLEIMIGLTTCTDASCDPPAGVAASGFLTVVASPGGTKQSPFTAKAVAFRDVVKQPQLATWVDFKAPQDVVLEEKPVALEPTASLDLTTLLAALAGGFILNFMPCVLPVIGLKVMGFVEQAGSDRREVIKLNLAYVLGIVSVMWVLAAITIASKNAFGWGQQFTLLEFKLAMAALVFAMSLSFLGVWEIPIPGFATSYRSNRMMEREGVVGAFAKGLLTTILATPCSGPFLGFVFAVTLTLAPLGVLVIYTLVGVGMGLPFLVLCLRPQLIRHLPKPGPWMETLKEFLAFPLLLTVVYFVASIGEDYRIATLSTLIAVWFACWLVGKVPAYAEMNTKVIRWSTALASIALWGMVSFYFLGPSKAELPWQPYSPDRLAALRNSGKTVMIDFTANWCVNCQYNTHFAIEKPRVAALINKNDVVPLLADWTEPSNAIAAQIGRLGSKTIPLLAIYPPDPNAEPIVLKDIIREKDLLEALEKAGPSLEPGGKMTATQEHPAVTEAQ